MVQISQGGRFLFKQLTGREIEGCRCVSDEVGESSEVLGPQHEMVEAEPRHQTSLQALSLAVCLPSELHEVIISKVRNSLSPHQVKVTLSVDSPLH